MDVTGIEPKSHAVVVQNVWSDDIVGPTLPRREAIGNTASSKAGLFLVPAIIED
jgi:aspartyl-tRNA(Asn)/glutamyl-tRNA(Gln) amidotransferase subunit C